MSLDVCVLGDHDALVKRLGAAVLLDPRDWWKAGLVVVDAADHGLRERLEARSAGLAPALWVIGGDWPGLCEYSGAGDLDRVLRDRPLLERRQAARAQLRRQIAHDLRTPLGIISGFGELLQEELLGPVVPKQRKALENIDQQATRLLTELEALAQDLTAPA